MVAYKTAEWWRFATAIVPYAIITAILKYHKRLLWHMGEADDDELTVEKGEEHIGARVDSETHRRLRVAAAERDEPMTDFIRHAVAKALAELDEGNGNQTAKAAASN